MTLAFENNNNIIVHAHKKIRFYARDNHYIFLGQSVRWISTIIGLQSKLVIYIGNLKAHTNIAGPHSPNHEGTVKPVDKCLVWTIKPVRTLPTIPPAIQEESRICSVPGQVHPDRRIQISQVSNSSKSETRCDRVLCTAKKPLLQSEKQQKIFTFDPVHRTRCGKIQPKKLTKIERKQLNHVSQLSPN